MTKKIYYPLAFALTVSLFGCNEAPLEIEKVTPDNSEIHSSMMEEVKQDVPTIDEVISQIELQEDINDGIDVCEFDEWYPFFNRMYSSDVHGDLGEIYAKVTDVRAYRTFTEAGLSPEDCWEIFYDEQTDRIYDGGVGKHFIVAVDFTVENINATSTWHYDPNYDNGYDEYDFRIDSLGGNFTSLIYWTGGDGSLKGAECKDHPYVFHLEPGETVSFTVYYHLGLYHSDDIDDEWFGWLCTSGTPELGYGVDLHLRDLIPEEWIEEAEGRWLSRHDD